MEKTMNKTSVLDSVILEHLLVKRRLDLLEILRGVQPCLRMDGYELMDVSDLVFTNLMIHPDKWFSKLDRLLNQALEKVFEESQVTLHFFIQNRN